MLTNMTSVPLSNWTMTFRVDQHITNIEHVNWSEFQDVFTVSGQGWTHRIEPGEVAWFTITGIAYDRIPEPPRNCFFNGTACTVEPHPNQVPLVAQSSEMIVSAWIEEYDFTTYRGFFVVQNPTDRVFSAPWGLQFSTPSQIVDIENVVWNRSGTDYQLYGNAHTDIVRPHDFVLIPFSGVHTGIPSLPTNCKLNGSFCSFQSPDRLVETPGLNVYLKMGEVTGTTWEGYIRIENLTVNELSSWTLRFKMGNTITESEGVIVDRSSIMADIRFLPGVFKNLIKNAAEHVAGLSNGDRMVDVVCEPAGKMVLIRVQNRGVPLSAERLITFFDKFNSTKTGQEGTGLGTSYACLVTLAHDGSIRVASDSDAGIVVSVFLPTA